MEGKICSKCGEFKSYSEFNKRKGSKDGYKGQCKQCRKEYDKQYRDSHKEELKEKHKQYYDSHKEERKQYEESHKEKRKEYKKQYYDSNKEYFKQYHESHKEERKVKRKQYYDSHKEEINKKHKQYYDSHKEELIEKTKEYYYSNKEERKVKRKQYRDSHKEEIKEKSKRYWHSNKNEIKEKQKQYHQSIKDKNIKMINEIIKNIEKYNLINKYNIPIYGYIYKIENTKTGRVYIGQSTTPISFRYKLNIIDGWKNERLNKNNQKFKDEILNTDDFKLTEILDVGICKYHLDKLEAYYINLYDSYNNGYNNNNGNHKTDDGIEEFKEILQYYNINENELIWRD